MSRIPITDRDDEGAGAHHAHHSHHDRPGHGPASEDDTALAEILDLDAVLGASAIAIALDAAADALDRAPRRIVDLGAGTGTGTIALATRFPEARVSAVDASPRMRDRIDAKAAASDLAHRVEALVADLDGDWLAGLPESLDLAWAALSLHHVTDPDRVLTQVFGALRPGGVLVVTEFTASTSYDFRGAEAHALRLGDRLVTASAARGYPVTAEWTSALAAVGFAPVRKLDTSVVVSAGEEDGARSLELQLTRSRSTLADDLTSDELVALDAEIAALVDRSSELTVTSGRAIWIAMRPAVDDSASPHVA